MNRNTGERDSLGRAIRETARGRRYVLDAQGKQQRPAGSAKRKRQENNARATAAATSNILGSQDLFVRAIERMIRNIMTLFERRVKGHSESFFGGEIHKQVERVGRVQVTVNISGRTYKHLCGGGEIEIKMPSGMAWYVAKFTWTAPVRAGQNLYDEFDNERLPMLPQTHYRVEFKSGSSHGFNAGNGAKDALDRIARAAIERYNANPFVVNRNRAVRTIQRAFRARVRRPAPPHPKVFIVLRKDLEDDLAKNLATWGLRPEISEPNLRHIAAMLTLVGETAIRKVQRCGLSVSDAMRRTLNDRFDLPSWNPSGEYPRLTPGYKLPLTDRQSTELMALLSRLYINNQMYSLLRTSVPLHRLKGSLLMRYRKEDLSRAFADDHAVTIQAAARGMRNRRKAARLLHEWYAPDGPGYHAAMRRLKGQTPGTNEFLINTMRNGPRAKLTRSASAAALTTPVPKKQRKFPKGSNAALLNAMPLNPRLFANRPRARNA